MIERPRFRYSYHVEAMEPEYVMLLTERQVFVLEGHAYKQMAPLLNGERTVDEIVELLEGKVEAPQIYYALDVLERKGYLVEGGAGPVEQAAFWDGVGVQGSATRRLSEARVEVRGLGGASTHGLEAALEGLGARVVPAGGELQLVVVDDYGRRGLSELNREALTAGRPWLLVKPVGMQAWLGPLFVPGKTGCWECLHERLRGNRQVESYIQRRKGSEEPLPTSLGWLPTSVGAAVNLAAMEAAKWLIAGRNERLQGKLLTLDMTSLETQEHVLVKRPQCPACGEERGPRQARPVVLESRKKRYTADGGHRVEPPVETFERLKHHISPITGVVSSLIRKDEHENGVTYSYAAGHAFPMLGDDLSVLRANMRFRSGGKGTTEIQARVSAVLESIERYSGVYRPGAPSIRASYRELGDQALQLRDVLLFSESQYRGRHAWNHQCSPTHYHVVPEPFDETATVDWTPLWSLTHACVRHLPSAYCYYAHPEGRLFFCATDANGTSAGNTLEEAILGGFLELVERDGVALWWYNRVRRPALDLQSFELPYLEPFARHHAAIRRDFWVLDLTTDLRIPTFAGVSRRTDRPAEDVIVGFGAHLDARVALLRALTEVNQFLPALSRDGTDGKTAYAYEDPDALHWWRTATIANQPYLTPDPAAVPRRAPDFARLASDDLAEDVKTCVRIAGERGLETLVLDQTLPDVGVPVARVVVPGLRHFWRRLGPGRLYDVPVKLGWLPAPLGEEQLNPLSMFF